MGILRWCIKLGQIDIIFPTGSMVQYQALPHLQQLMVLGQIVSYLKKHQCSRLVFDPRRQISDTRISYTLTGGSSIAMRWRLSR